MKPLFIFLLTYLLLFFQSLYPNKLYSQPQIEMTIPWENDTMTQGLFAQQTPDGNYLILTANYYFPPEPGFPVSGTVCYGNGLIKVSQNGEILWKKLFNTSYYQTPIGDLSNFSPASFFIIRDSQIIVPFRMTIGSVICDSINSNTEIDTWYTGVLSVNASSGELIHKQIFYGDGFCAANAYEAFTVLNDSVFLTIEHNTRYYYKFSSNVMLKNLKKPAAVFEFPILDSTGKSYLTSSDYIGGFLREKEFLFDPKDTSFIIHPNEYFLKINSKAEMKYLFKPQEDGSFTRYNDYYYIVYDEVSNGNISSVFAKMNQNGEVVKKLYIENGHYYRGLQFSIGKNGKIILLSRSPEYLQFSSNEKPLRIILTDTSLNTFTYRDFGSRYIEGSNINMIEEERSFLVTGTRVNYPIDWDSLKEPHQVYFLKSSIDSINIPWTSFNEYSPTKNNSFDINPNPASSSIMVNISLKSKNEQFYILTLKNISGQIFLQKKVHSSKTVLNISNIPNGFYLLSLEEIFYNNTNKEAVGIKQIKKIIKINSE